MPPPLPWPLIAHVGAQPAPALPASDSRAAPNAAAIDARIAVLEVVRILVGLEKQRLQLQHVRRAVGQGECEASLAQELDVLLELVPQVFHAHQLSVGVVLGKRQRVDARALFVIHMDVSRFNYMGALVY
eukprot:1183389-Pleurochrysis_carterae.AAC.2